MATSSGCFRTDECRRPLSPNPQARLTEIEARLTEIAKRPRQIDEGTLSMATRRDTRSPAPHAADSYESIRVHGARVNNLKDVSVEIPKRRLTVFTGVSGSGKSSLVFDTIAAESQRLINETYSAFVQGFMPTLARPEVDVLEGLTTAIIVDQQRMRRRSGRGSSFHGGYRHRRGRDAAHPLQPARAAAHRLAGRVCLQRCLGPGERCNHD
jgi:hypothetical protein